VLKVGEEYIFVGIDKCYDRLKVAHEKREINNISDERGRQKRKKKCKSAHNTSVGMLSG